MILVVLIVGLVVALVMPTLRDLRRRALELKSLANLRSHAQILSVYAGDEADGFPFFTDPEAPLSVVRGGGVAVAVSHFQSFWTWNIALADNYFGGEVLPEALVVPGMGSRHPITMYWYGDCFVARPDFWRLETRRVGTSQWRGTRASEVLFPSQKGVVFEMSGIGEHGLFPRLRFSTVDGAAASRLSRELTRPLTGGVGNGFGAGPNMFGHIVGMPVMHTIGGVQGRDVR